MVQIVEQRPYIENFLDFVSSFCITEKVTLDEMLLVESNLDILKQRIRKLRETTIIGGEYQDLMQRSKDAKRIQ